MLDRFYDDGSSDATGLTGPALDAVVIGHSPHVYYFTAHLPFWQQFAGRVFADGSPR